MACVNRIRKELIAAGRVKNRRNKVRFHDRRGYCESALIKLVALKKLKVLMQSISLCPKPQPPRRFSSFCVPLLRLCFYVGRHPPGRRQTF